MEPTLVMRNDSVILGGIILSSSPVSPTVLASGRVDFSRDFPRALASSDAAKAYCRAHNQPDTHLERSLGRCRLLAQTPLHLGHLFQRLPARRV